MPAVRDAGRGRVWRLHPAGQSGGTGRAAEKRDHPLKRRTLFDSPGRRRALAAAAIAATGILVVPASAESQTRACPEGRISEVVIENGSVFDLDDADLQGRFSWAYRLANALHVPTRADVVEREILFEAGDCYDIELLRDSERLLRGFDFLADADIYGIRQADGRVQVIVDTRDEWSTRIEPRIGSRGTMGFEGIRIVEDNVLGTGRHFSLFYEREDEERVYGTAYRAPHFLDTRWDLGLMFARTEVGYSYEESLVYPFVGEIGRIALRQSVGRSDRYFELLTPSGTDDALEHLLVPVRREHFEVAGAVRTAGRRFQHTVFGAAVAGERIQYPGELVVADLSRALDDEDRRRVLEGVEVPWIPVSNVRALLLAGQRNVWFVRRRALDTVNGVEDVQLGVEADVTLGPTLPVISDDRDFALGLRLFAAGEVGADSFVGGQFNFEGRRSYDAIADLPEWHDVLAEFNLWAYLREPSSRHTFVATLAGVGGWHGRVPFQLTLGGETGLRGYPRHVDPGGRRLVASLEHRAYWGGPFADLLDLGSVVFLDGGKIWPGHAPFGTGSPIRGSIGVGLRAAFPPGSRQTFRFDVGFPVQRAGGFGDLTFTVGVGQAIGRQVGRRDPQLVRSSRYGLSSPDFMSPQP